MKNYSLKTLYVHRGFLIQGQIVVGLRGMKVLHEVHSAKVGQYRFELIKMKNYSPKTLYVHRGFLIQGQIVVGLKGMKV